MFKLFALASVLTSAVLAQSSVGFFFYFFSSNLTLFIVLFRPQTPSFRLEFPNLATRFWLHLIRIPPSTAALLRWQISPLPSPQAPRPLHLQTFRPLWPISVPIQLQARVPSLSFARRSRLSSQHALPNWLTMPTKLFALFMKFCMDLTPS